MHSETVETIRQKLKSGAAILAEVNGVVAGCVFYQHESSHVYLGRLSVLPEYRRRGVGRALIDYVEGRARVLRAPRVQIGVRLLLTDVRAYYERLGYRVVRYAAHAGYTEPTSVVMEKDLSEPRVSYRRR